MLKLTVFAVWLVFWLCHWCPAESNVICGDTKMKAGVEKAKYPLLRLNHLRYTGDNNGACKITSNETHFVFDIPLTSCGTELTEDADNLIFKNEMFLTDNAVDIITRKCLLELKFICTYPKRGNVSLNFMAHREKVFVEEKGVGKFTYQFEFYRSAEYSAPFEPEEYPLRCDRGSRIFMQIEATSSVSNTELFVESCKAAPYDNVNYEPSYTIIDDGCNKDSTLKIHSSPSKRIFRFSMEAFKFIGRSDQVFISCSVMMCEVEGTNTRCSQGCINARARRDIRYHHVKRESPNQSTRHFISQGPLRIKRSAESDGNPAVALNLNLVFIAGCLLAAVGMICAAVVYKSKISQDKYKPLPQNER